MKIFKILTVFILFPFLLAAQAQDGPQRCGQAVVTCFSGSDGVTDGVVAALKDLSNVSGQTTGTDLSGSVPTIAMWTKSELGEEVFGIAIDKRGDIFFSATAVYGKMASQANTGGIFKVDGSTLLVDGSWNAALPNFLGNAQSLGFTLQPICGDTADIEAFPGLGNICYDAEHDQLLVTNFEDGTIYALDPLSGNILTTYDPMGPDDRIPGFAPLGERIWGIAAHQNDQNETVVYYSVWTTDLRNKYNAGSIGNNTIRRVKLDAAGLFDPGSDEEVITLPFLDFAISGGNDQCEFPSPQLSCPVSDIAISDDGRTLLLAERSMHGDLRSSPNNVAFRWAHNSRLLEYKLQNELWTLSRQLDVGDDVADAPLPRPANSAGGVAFGDGFRAAGGESCDSTVWVTGDYLNDDLGRIYGMQGFAINEPNVSNTSSYLLDFDGNISNYDKSFIGDVALFDCISCKKAVCGQITGTVDSLCSFNDRFLYDFQFENNTEYEVTSVVINAITPEGVTLSEQFFNFYQDPIPPSGSSPELHIEIVLPEGLEEPLDVCFDVVYLTDNFACCHYQHCVELNPVNICDYVNVETVESEVNCCYDLLLENEYCEDFFVGVQTEILTPGVQFGDLDGNGIWSNTVSADSTFVTWNTIENDFPVGILQGISFCLKGVVSNLQIPQQIAVHFLTTTADGRTVVACTEIIEVQCSPCMDLEGEAVCSETGGHMYNYSLQNNSGEDINLVVFEVHTPGVLFSPAFMEVNLAADEAFSGSISITDLEGNPLPTGTTISFKVALFNQEGWCCHLDDLEMVMPDCRSLNADCACLEESIYEANIQMGFLPDRNCNTRQAIFHAAGLDVCDSVRWQIEAPGITPILLSTRGDEPAIFTFSPNRNYTISFTANRYLANGLPCYPDQQFSYSGTYLFNCLPNINLSDSEIKVSIFPIPSKDQINFVFSESGKYTLQILDINGGRLQETAGYFETNEQKQLDISHLPPGLFTLQFRNEQGVMTQRKFVKIP